MKYPFAPALALLAFSGLAHGAVATFDDLPSPPPLDSNTDFQYANGNSLGYAGVVWDARFRVAGDLYKVAPPGGPLFGLPRSGHYFLTNGDGGTGLSIATDQALLGAWFGRNEYYGYGGGADQVTITAFSSAAPLSLSFNLPAPAVSGQPSVLAYFDTGAFAGLAGITGYRIDRRELGSQSGHWVADDFQFTPVPLPAAFWLLGPALAGLGWLGRRRGGRTALK